MHLDQLNHRLERAYGASTAEGLKEIKRLRDEEGWEGIYGPVIDLIAVDPKYHTVMEVR